MTRWADKARKLPTIARWIEENLPELEVVLDKHTVRPQHKIRGTRIVSSPGKPRTGYRLRVYRRGEKGWDHFAERGKLLDHDTTDGYHQNAEVERWLQQYLACKAGTHGKAFGGTCPYCVAKIQKGTV